MIKRLTPGQRDALRNGLIMVKI